MTSERTWALRLLDTGAVQFELDAQMRFEGEGPRKRLVVTSTDTVMPVIPFAPLTVGVVVTTYGNRMNALFRTSPDDGATWNQLGSRVVSA